MSDSNYYPDFKHYEDWFSKYSIPVPDALEAEKLYFFLNLVWEWNLKINLTSSSGKQEVLERHIMDSLVLNHFNQFFLEYIVDLGSGGGFPSIPMAICYPGHSVFLIERVARKCAFLNAVKRKLGLKNVTVLNSDLSHIQPFSHSFTCISRAVRVDEKVVTQLKRLGAGNMIIHKSEREHSTGMEYRLPGESRDRYISVVDFEA